MADHANDTAFVQAAHNLLSCQRDLADAARGSFFKVWDKLDRKQLRRWMKITPKARARA